VGVYQAEFHVAEVRTGAVREQDLPYCPNPQILTYFEVEGKPGSQPKPCPLKETGQFMEAGAETEVLLRCVHCIVNSVVQRECHPVSANSHLPVLLLAC